MPVKVVDMFGANKLPVKVSTFSTCTRFSSNQLRTNLLFICTPTVNRFLEYSVIYVRPLI